MVQQSGNVAFVAGANGISGHAIIEHLTRTDKKEWYVVLRQLQPANANSINTTQEQNYHHLQTTTLQLLDRSPG